MYGHDLNWKHSRKDMKRHIKRALTFSLNQDRSTKIDDPETEQIKPFIIPLFDIPPRDPPTIRTWTSLPANQ